MLIVLLHNYNPLLVLDRLNAYRLYGRGVQFVMPSATALQAALRTLRKYGVRTYAYKFTRGGGRSFRVRREQAQWAHYLLAGHTPPAWSDAQPNARARAVGYAGAILNMFMGK